MLLGQLPREVLRRSRWKLVLDNALFGLPFSALTVQGENGRPVYLIQQHALEVLPAALMSPAQQSGGGTVFAGFGDPVYNRADVRFDVQRAQRETHWSGMFFASADTPATLELNRLTGSQEEVESCARRWGGNQRIMLGGDVSRQQLLQTVRMRPQVLHLALHVIQPQESNQTQIALGLKPDGAQDLMGPDDIRTLQSDIGIVALSGCSSGRGRVLPAAGVVGLTRAWLQAGAHSVAASLWRVSDDDGFLFRKFYEHLPSRDSARQSAGALRAAQLEMLGSADWHADPRYWAAYFIVSRGLTE
jgi:CHAT domain-containing protein